MIGHAMLRPDSFIYAIRRDDSGLIKFGVTGALRTRFADLRYTTKAPLTPLAYIPARRDQETELHRLLGAWREIGEWFRPAAPVIAAVSMMRPWPADGKKLPTWWSLRTDPERLALKQRAFA